MLKSFSPFLCSVYVGNYLPSVKRRQSSNVNIMQLEYIIGCIYFTLLSLRSLCCGHSTGRRKLFCSSLLQSKLSNSSSQERITVKTMKCFMNFCQQKSACFFSSLRWESVQLTLTLSSLSTIADKNFCFCFGDLSVLNPF